MSEISIDIGSLEQLIANMNNLKASWQKEEIPDCSCEGRTATQLSDIAEAYSALYDSICNLTTSTLAYLNSLKGAYMYADNNTSFNG